MDSSSSSSDSLSPPASPPPPLPPPIRPQRSLSVRSDTSSESGAAGKPPTEGSGLFSFSPGYINYQRSGNSNPLIRPRVNSDQQLASFDKAFGVGMKGGVRNEDKMSIESDSSLSSSSIYNGRKGDVGAESSTRVFEPFNEYHQGALIESDTNSTPRIPTPILSTRPPPPERANSSSLLVSAVASRGSTTTGKSSPTPTGSGLLALPSSESARQSASSTLHPSSSSPSSSSSSIEGINGQQDDLTHEFAGLGISASDPKPSSRRSIEANALTSQISPAGENGKDPDHEEDISHLMFSQTTPRHRSLSHQSSISSSRASTSISGSQRWHTPGLGSNTDDDNGAFGAEDDHHDRFPPLYGDNIQMQETDLPTSPQDRSFASGSSPNDHQKRDLERERRIRSIAAGGSGEKATIRSPRASEEFRRNRESWAAAEASAAGAARAVSRSQSSLANYESRIFPEEWGIRPSTSMGDSTYETITGRRSTHTNGPWNRNSSVATITRASHHQRDSSISSSTTLASPSAVRTGIDRFERFTSPRQSPTISPRRSRPPLPRDYQDTGAQVGIPTSLSNDVLHEEESGRRARLNKQNAILSQYGDTNTNYSSPFMNGGGGGGGGGTFSSKSDRALRRTTIDGSAMSTTDNRRQRDEVFRESLAKLSGSSPITHRRAHSRASEGGLADFIYPQSDVTPSRFSNGLSNTPRRLAKTSAERPTDSRLSFNTLSGTVSRLHASGSSSSHALQSLRSIPTTEHNRLLIETFDRFDAQLSAYRGDLDVTSTDSPNVISRTAATLESSLKVNEALRDLSNRMVEAQMEAELNDSTFSSASEIASSFEQSVLHILQTSDEQLRRLRETLSSLTRYDREYGSMSRHDVQESPSRIVPRAATSQGYHHSTHSPLSPRSDTANRVRGSVIDSLSLRSQSSMGIHSSQRERGIGSSELRSKRWESTSAGSGASNTRGQQQQQQQPPLADGGNSPLYTRARRETMSSYRSPLSGTGEILPNISADGKGPSWESPLRSNYSIPEIPTRNPARKEKSFTESSAATLAPQQLTSLPRNRGRASSIVDQTNATLFASPTHVDVTAEPHSRQTQVYRTLSDASSSGPVKWRAKSHQSQAHRGESETSTTGSSPETRQSLDFPAVPAGREERLGYLSQQKASPYGTGKGKPSNFSSEEEDSAPISSPRSFNVSDADVASPQFSLSSQTEERRSERRKEIDAILRRASTAVVSVEH